MAVIQTGNFIPELDALHLSNTDDDRHAHPTAEIICNICERRKLTISGLVRKFIDAGERAPEYVAHPALSRPDDLYAHGFERTVVFPCGHIFGDRCLRNLANPSTQKNLTCPTCGFPMTYEACGHAIAPAVICDSVHDDASLLDTFPLTIPEGGQKPRHCKECRWRMIRKKLSYTLNAACVLCSHTTAQTEDAVAEHEAHRLRHIEQGLKDGLGEIMKLVQPDFITRETERSAQKAKEENEQRDVNTALLYAIALTELEETIWYRTSLKEFSKERERRHALGVQAIENVILGLLMGYGERNGRRMW
ncbi:hypothetical protein GGR50DRAFT_411493 [Xylaria sp. CBS 124048]|nr:hypothetical protein GGR50DRAFT_411493 [Xylaria sp. CBS 124048]